MASPRNYLHYENNLDGKHNKPKTTTSQATDSDILNPNFSSTPVKKGQQTGSRMQSYFYSKPGGGEGPEAFKSLNNFNVKNYTSINPSTTSAGNNSHHQYPLSNISTIKSMSFVNSGQGAFASLAFANQSKTQQNFNVQNGSLSEKTTTTSTARQEDLSKSRKANFTGLQIETSPSPDTKGFNLKFSQLNSYSATNSNSIGLRNVLSSAFQSGNMTSKYSKPDFSIPMNKFSSKGSPSNPLTQSHEHPLTTLKNEGNKENFENNTSKSISNLDPSKILASNSMNTPQTSSSSNNLLSGATPQNKSYKDLTIATNTLTNNVIPTVTSSTPASTNNTNNNSNTNSNPNNGTGNLNVHLINSPTNGKMTPIPNHEPTKCSFKRNGIVKGYAANTNQGIVRNYNEDRVSIILNIMKPASRANENWPKCSFFGVYDGHGGVNCADFLRDNLHQFVIKEPSFPWNPKEALKKGFEAAEKHFLEVAANQANGQIDKSGSCAIVVLIVGDMCYTANVGDSRAVMSGDGGSRIYPLSRDHKPLDELEYKRITEAGGKIYQTQAQSIKPGSKNNAQSQLLLGPYRVLPGRLSVSRTFGDIEAKDVKYGGNPNVVIAEPEVKAFKISDDHDFIIIACDGIYDKMSSREAVQSVWETMKDCQGTNVHQQCGLGVENILRESINRRTLDNITVVMISFSNFKRKLKQIQKELEGKEETQYKEPMTKPLKPASGTARLSDIQEKNERKEDLDNFRKTTDGLIREKSAKENDNYNRKFQEKSSAANASAFQFKKGISVQKSLEQDSFKRKKKIFEYKNDSANLSGNQSSSHMSKLRMLDQKISEITNKLHQTIAESK